MMTAMKRTSNKCRDLAAMAQGGVNHYAVFKVPAFLKVNEKKAMTQVSLANELIAEHGTMFPDDTFEDGVIAALTWVFGDSAEPLSHDLGGE